MSSNGYVTGEGRGATDAGPVGVDGDGGGEQSFGHVPM